MAKPKMLTDMDIKEVSVVKSPANKQKFLFFKNEDADKDEKTPLIKLDEPLTVTFKSNGKANGTSITVNGVAIKKADSFSLYYSKPNEDQPGEMAAVSVAYSRNKEADGGFKGQETYFLQKQKGDNLMFEDSLKKLSGDEAYEFVAKEISKDKNEEIQKALDTIGEYQEDFTDELKKAVLTMAEYAASAIPVEKQEDETNADTKKEEKTETEKSADEKSEKGEKTETEDDLAKSVEEILTSVKEVKEEVTKSAESMKEFDSRLETVEKSTGARQSIKGQDVKKESGETFKSIEHLR